MKVGDLVRLVPDCGRAWCLPKLTKYIGIVKEKHSTEPLVHVFWKEGLNTAELEDHLEVIHESR